MTTKKFYIIIEELKHHAPFTAFGAFVGTLIVVVLSQLQLLPQSTYEYHNYEHVFHILHLLHILLSAFVTASMYVLRIGKNIHSIIIGIIGAVGICTLSDIAFPYIGAYLLQLQIELHICLIKEPQLILPMAIVGSIGGYLKPTTRCPHALHVLLSTCASLFYLVAYSMVANWLYLLPIVFAILFVAVWIPCCVSDIVFPLLFRPQSVK